VPFVSVVTPFYNTAPYLRECIESVLAQTLGDFEYLLVDNKSTDGSRDIAEQFARRDSRIRVIENEVFVGQVENYNGALERISPKCEFVKLTQADDALLPECLRLMVENAQRDPRVGIVSSYFLKGSTPSGRGVPYGTTHVNGRAIVRGIMLGTAYPFGSPTSMLYRASVVRARKPFYALGRYHEDSEAACEILLEHDLGFVHQVLSFCRTDNEGIMSAAERFNPAPLDHLIVLERYGREVLSPEEFAQRKAVEWRVYLGFLGNSVLRGRGEKFWKYHRAGLATIGRPLGKRELLLPTLKQVARAALNPVQAIEIARERAHREE
jgi:glycosyltransferase involved in cell wall biosynthesis